MSTTSLREALRRVESELAGQRWQNALNQCENLLAIHPQWLDALRVKAEVLIALNRLPEAEELIDGILAAHPEHVPAFVARAQIAAKRQDSVAMLTCYRRICEMATPNMQWRVSYNQIAQQMHLPGYTPSHTGLARLYLRSELYVQSFKEWQTALNANPTRVDAMVGVAETLWRMRNAVRAQEMCSFILQRHPRVLKALLIRAFFEAEAGNTDIAQQLINDAATMDPEQTIAGTMFADYVAGGHLALTDLFRKTARSLTRPVSSPPIVQLPPAPVPELRTMTDPLPDGQLKTGPLFAKTAPLHDAANTGSLQQPAHQSGSLDKQDQLEDYFSQSRASLIAPEFAQIFKETENMLWDPRGDDDFSQELPALANVPPPPALAAAMAEAAQPDETERNFIQWLQSQGAVSLEHSGANASGGSTSVPIEMPPFLQQAFSAPDAPIEAVGDTHAPFDGMIASQSTETAEHSFTSDIPTSAPVQPNIMPEQQPIVAQSAPGPLHLNDNIHRAPEIYQQQRATASPMAEPADGNASSVTIEAIEEGLVSAGFSPMETGRLSTISSGEQSPAVHERSSEERMQEARRLRREGKVGEALLEYHILVKTSADLADIIRDLRDTAIEDPHEPEIHRLLGDAYIRQGNYIEALEAYNQSSNLRQSARG